MTDPVPALRANGLTKSYDSTPALVDVRLELAPGETVAVTGPSGSGKSTLLLCLSGILRPDAGSVELGGERIDDRPDAARTALRRSRVGVVLQFGQLVPELTAEENVMLPLLLGGRSRAEARESARGWLRRLGVDGSGRQVASRLSGGQSQRVAVARALVTGPEVVVADEPTGSLDSVGGDEVLEALTTSCRQLGAALLVVTHDNRVAARMSRELVMVDGVLTGAEVLR